MTSAVAAPMSAFAQRTFESKYAHTKPSGRKETWAETAHRVAESVTRAYLPRTTDRVRALIESRKFMPGGRYLYACGRRFQQVNNCFLFRADDSREGWGSLCNKTANALMTGGGIGVVYSDVRPEGYETKGMGGKATGPCSIAGIINEQGRRIMQGGSRRSAIWGGLHWWHPDIMKWVGQKNWHEVVVRMKAMDFNWPGEMDMTNISVILDDDFFEAYHTPGWRRDYKRWGTSFSVDQNWAADVYWATVRGMLKTGEPGFSVDIGDNDGENLRNACCEVTSKDDSDMCNLGSLNLARFDSADEFAEAVEVCTAFLLCGTLCSELPLESMYRVREKNRRLGLGLMGVHEWLLLRGKRYGADAELASWLDAYCRSGDHARRYADSLSVSRPVATRSIAPTGTISIVAETTSGVEPVMAVAYKRRYLDGSVWKAQYVLDPTARRLIEERGVEPCLIEDSYTLAEDVERRMDFQAWLQQRVDHGISSTINLPRWGTPGNNEMGVTRFGNSLLERLPRLRGITAYPDGGRGGQPFNRVSYDEAKGRVGAEFVEGGDASGDSYADALQDMLAASCKGGVCGT